MSDKDPDRGLDDDLFGYAAQQRMYRERRWARHCFSAWLRSHGAEASLNYDRMREQFMEQLDTEEVARALNNWKEDGFLTVDTTSRKGLG